MLLSRPLLRVAPRRGFLTLAGRRAQFDTQGRGDGFAKRVSQQPATNPPPPNEPPSQPGVPQSSEPYDKVANALQQSTEGDANNLLAPVHIPNDPQTVLPPDHPSTSILANSSVVIQRQLEMMNVMLGFEQANKYVIMDGHGSHIGYLAEQDHGFGSAMARQAFRTHRSFTTHVFDRHENEVLRFHRPFSWISSRIRVYDANTPSDMYAPSSALAGTSTGSITNSNGAQISQRPLSDMRVIGEAQQQWAPLRRKYNLFLHRDLSKDPSDTSSPQLTSGDLPLSTSTAVSVADDGKAELGMRQFAYVDEPMLSWDFSLKTEDQRLVGSVNRNFAGWGREIFTDTGVYALRMDSADLQAAQTEEALGMTLDQRAIMLATAVSIDFDYFSRHSGSGIGGGFMPLWFPWGGGTAAGEAGAGEAAAGGAAAGEAGAAGTAVGEAGQAARGLGAGEGIAGAGTMAGYEAMQRGREASSEPAQDPQSPQASDWPPTQDQDPYGDRAAQQGGSNEDVWGQGDDPFEQQQGGDGGDGGGSGFSIWDIFNGGD